MAVVKAIRGVWSDCFGEQADWTQEFKRSDGGFDGEIWPHLDPNGKIAFKTFPSPESQLTAAVARETLKDVDLPCLIVTRLPLHQGTTATIRKSRSNAVQFVQWTGAGQDEQLEISPRILRDSLPG